MTTIAAELDQIALADLDADGLVDLIGVDPTGKDGVELWRGTGLVDAAPFVRRRFSSVVHRYHPAIIDFDRNGSLDLLVAHRVADEGRNELVWLPGVNPAATGNAAAP